MAGMKRGIHANRTWGIVLGLGLACCNLPSATGATTETWADGSSDWNTAGNWNPQTVPGAGDTADITNTDGVPRTITYDYTGSAVTLAALTVNLMGGNRRRPTRFPYQLMI